jgi:phosphogluconate dehydratase
MSGASGTVPAAIHLTPEAAAGGPIARIRDGDLLRLDARTGVLEIAVPDSELAARTVAEPPTHQHVPVGTGRELFTAFRRHVGPAEHGASVIHHLTKANA